MTEQQAIEHDAGVFASRARIMENMRLAELLVRIMGGESDVNALAVTTADEHELWEGDELPQWVMDAAEWAVAEVDKILEDENV